jgi:hypothetical protein
MPPKVKKGSRSGVEMDPAVNIVKGVLEQNVTFFVQNVSQYITKYQQHLNECLAILSAQPNISLQTPATTPEAPVASAPAAAAPPTTTPADATAAATAADETAVGPVSPAVIGKVTVNETEEEDVLEVEFPDNEELCKQLKSLKREAYELSTTFDGISDWIDLNAPDKEKGAEDSVGAEVQDAVIEQIGSLNEAVKGVYDLEFKYLSDRTDLETQVLKAPQVRSLQLQLEIGDADMWDEVERSWRAMIRVCLILYSVLTKNMTRLKNPDGPKSLSGYH